MALLARGYILRREPGDGRREFDAQARSLGSAMEETALLVAVHHRKVLELPIIIIHRYAC